MTNEHYMFGQAREASDEAARSQEAAEEEIVRAGRAYAEAEKTYRKALAMEMFRLSRQKVAWTVTPDLARGEDHVADLKCDRDDKKAVYEAAKQAAYRHSANRRDTETFVTWSMKRDLAEGYGRSSEPRTTTTFGRQAA